MSTWADGAANQRALQDPNAIAISCPYNALLDRVLTVYMRYPKGNGKSYPSTVTRVPWSRKWKLSKLVPWNPKSVKATLTALTLKLFWCQPSKHIVPYDNFDRRPMLFHQPGYICDMLDEQIRFIAIRLLHSFDAVWTDTHWWDLWYTKICHRRSTGNKSKWAPHRIKTLLDTGQKKDLPHRIRYGNAPGSAGRPKLARAFLR